MLRSGKTSSSGPDSREHIAISTHLQRYSLASGMPRRKRTPGSSLLRAIVSKFNETDPASPVDVWGELYAGDDPEPLNAEEERLRKL